MCLILVRGGVKSTNKQEDVSMYSNDNGIQYNQESSDDEDQHFKRSSILRVNFTATVHFYIIYIYKVITLYFNI